MTTPSPLSSPQHTPSGDVTRVVPDDFVFPGTEKVNRAEVFATPGYQAPQPSVPVLARAALIVAIISVFLQPLGIVALILGIVAYMRRIPHNGAEETSALAGIVIGAMTTTSFVWIFLLWVSI